MRASVIVPARDAEATLERTLRCLVDQDAGFDYEVIVVDDGSVDGTPELVPRFGRDVRLVRGDGTGPAAARNLGVASCSGAMLAFCDADCFPTRGWLAAGLEALGEAELVQGRVLPEPGVAIGPYDRTLWVTHEVGLWETANLFVTRPAFDSVGGFEDWLRPVAGKAMAEDVWFGWRTKRQGAASSFCEAALVHHAVFPRSRRAYVAERRRLRHFPEIVARMPELRGAFLHRRVFLNRRTEALAAAVAGVLLAAALRRTLPLIALLPYGRLAARRAASHGAGTAAVDAAADLLGAWALLSGSVTARTPVL